MFVFAQSKLLVNNFINISMPFASREACKIVNAVTVAPDPEEMDSDEPHVTVPDSVRKALRQKLHRRFHHYTGMDKRDFQKTWADCPPIKLRKKLNFDDDEYQFVSRRKKPYHFKAAVKFTKVKSPSTICARLANISCKSDRYPPSCKVYTPVANYKKECCPHPSFSECCHPDPPLIKVKENGWYFPHKCETNEFFRHKILNKLPPALPAWPPET